MFQGIGLDIDIRKIGIKSVRQVAFLRRDRFTITLPHTMVKNVLRLLGKVIDAVGDFSEIVQWVLDYPNSDYPNSRLSECQK